MKKNNATGVVIDHIFNNGLINEVLKNNVSVFFKKENLKKTQFLQSV